ncbi:MAG TPA: PAS domain-containing protein [Candidatus Aquilonibacter sp.]
MHRSELLEFAIEQANDGIAVMKFTGDPQVPIHIVYANDTIERFSGYTHDELLDSSNPFLRIQPQNRSLYDSLFEKIRAGIPVRFEIELGGKNRSMWVEIRWSPLRYADGEVTHYVAVLRDIGERRRAQAERELLYRAIEQADDGICIVDVPENDPNRRRLIYANDALCRILRSSREAIFEEGLARYFFDDRPELLDRYLADVMKGATFKREVHVTRGDASKRWIEMTAAPFTDESGKILRVIGTYRDVEDRKRNEEQRALLHSILSETSDFVVMADDSRPSAGGPLVTYANPAFAALLGAGPERIAGAALASFFSPDNDSKLLANLAARLERHERISHELMLRGYGGGDRWVELTGHRVRGEAGGASSWLFIGKDISVRKHGYTQTAQLLTALDLAEEPIAIYDVREPLDLELQHVNERARENGPPLLERLLRDPLQRARIETAWPDLASGWGVQRLVLGGSADGPARWTTLEIRPLHSGPGTVTAIVAIEHVLRVDSYNGLADGVGTALELGREIRSYSDMPARCDGFCEALREVWGITPSFVAGSGNPEVVLHAGECTGCAVLPSGVLFDRPVAVELFWIDTIAARQLTALRLFLEMFARSD